MKQPLRKRLVLVGAGGAGKTTLARFLSAAFHAPVVASASREIHARHGAQTGYAGCSDLKKAEVQRAIMAAQVERVENAPLGSIVDRCALDVQAYNYLELGRSEDEAAQACLRYGAERCRLQQDLTDTLYFLVHPTIPLVGDGVRYVQEGLRQQIHLLLLGMLNEYGYRYAEVCAPDPLTRVGEVLLCVRRGHLNRALTVDYNALHREVAAWERERALAQGAGC